MEIILTDFSWFFLSFPPARFLPSLARSALEKNLADAAIEVNAVDNLEPELENYKCKYLIWFFVKLNSTFQTYYTTTYLNFNKKCFLSILFSGMDWRNEFNFLKSLRTV